MQTEEEHSKDLTLLQSGTFFHSKNYKKINESFTYYQKKVERSSMEQTSTVFNILESSMPLGQNDINFHALKN